MPSSTGTSSVQLAVPAMAPTYVGRAHRELAHFTSELLPDHRDHGQHPACGLGTQ